MTGLHVEPGTAALDDGYVAATRNCLPEHVGAVGGKAVGLGSLVRAGQRVPPSFVITAAAYRDYVLAGAHGLTAPIREAIGRSYEVLCELHGAELTVAVRSSATVEDSTDASCAGQFRTFLGACGTAEVLEQVEQCWLAAKEPQVGSYRAQRQIAAGDDAVAVIVQELVDARAAGVMFTQHPRTGDRSLIVIESSYGLGEAVVGGEVTPDLFEINKITGGTHQSRLGTKTYEHRLAAGGRSVRSLPVERARQQAWSLSGGEVTALVTLASDLEASLGRGLDTEWAIGTTGSTRGEQALFSLQARPITVAPRRPAQGRPAGDAVDRVLGRLASRPPGTGAA
ncbi:MAG TPA: PEP/pyruvate-binding domain-containing protein [Streptosporangiaceae bacterium]|nr:PEP/pyruvate-binding domain-containing protein [Streptosporangiaceae bacterium]